VQFPDGPLGPLPDDEVLLHLNQIVQR